MLVKIYKVSLSDLTKLHPCKKISVYGKDHSTGQHQPLFILYIRLLHEDQVIKLEASWKKNKERNIYT